MQGRSNEEAVSPVMATILLAAIVIVLGASVFALLGDFRDHAPDEAAPVIAVANRDGELRTNSWSMKLVSSSPVQPVDNYLFILRTPANGTLVGQAPSSTFGDTVEMYFQLGNAAGQGRHTDNGTVVGADGLGGYHFRITDTDGNDRFGGGDHIDIWYDGDGDQAHQNGRDDAFPTGVYEFELKHEPSQSYVALQTRQY